MPARGLESIGLNAAQYHRPPATRTQCSESVLRVPQVCIWVTRLKPARFSVGFRLLFGVGTFRVRFLASFRQVLDPTWSASALRLASMVLLRLLRRCGSAEGLDAGRHCFRKWGFRRCEDICWIKTNKDPNRKYILQQDTHACLVHTKVRASCACRPAVISLLVCQLLARW